MGKSCLGETCAPESRRPTRACPFSLLRETDAGHDSPPQLPSESCFNEKIFPAPKS